MTTFDAKTDRKANIIIMDGPENKQICAHEYQWQFNQIYSKYNQSMIMYQRLFF